MQKCILQVCNTRETGDMYSIQGKAKTRLFKQPKLFVLSMIFKAFSFNIAKLSFDRSVSLQNTGGPHDFNPYKQVDYVDMRLKTVGHPEQ